LKTGLALCHATILLSASYDLRHNQTMQYQHQYLLDRDPESTWRIRQVTFAR
jgi:hypothetical protein